MKKVPVEIKTLVGAIISLPVAWGVFGWGVPQLGNGELSGKGCSIALSQTPVRNIAQTLPPVSPNAQKPLPLLPVSKSPFGCCEPNTSCWDEVLWGEGEQPGDKQSLIKSIDYSLRYLSTPRATEDYQDYLVGGITRERVVKSLQRFRQLLLNTKSAQELKQAVEREFVFYKSVGKDGNGNVLFTAYYEPVYVASRVQTPEFRYPLYKRPPDLDAWPRPHPTRLQLEGADGLQGSKGKLRGLELFWFRDRIEPFMIQIQGSARLKLTDGKTTTVAYDGGIAQNYVSIGRELGKDGKLPLAAITMPLILEYFEKYPAEMNVYLPRNPSFVFFKDSYGAPAQGSVGVPVTANRSIATDKSLMPPGALALIRASFPFPKGNRELEHRIVSRYVLDQDTGGAIKGAGRVDYFVGTGDIAGDRAGVTVSNGQLYYLLLK